ncbi:glycosyl hydrolase [Paraglaciecola polaris]|uniref:glycosyl hydrolase n=1 Tax=Paraglaciecola polaris TaxID=222814 RepID=UPI0030EF5A5C|tara:strand:+ start:1010 stop:4201 length:3192 start_codon:yes stop_codon:yes gene_type:complete
MFNQTNSLSRCVLGVSVALGLSGCLGGESLNTESATYVPESRPLNVIAPSDMEVKPGDDVTLSGRLVGTTDGQTIVWSQVRGTAVTITDPTVATLTFSIPDSIRSDKLVFQISALNADGSAATDESGAAIVDTVEITVFDPDSVITLDVSADSATLNGATLVVEGDDMFVAGANNNTHTADINPGMSVTFNIDDQVGFYTLNVRYLIPTDYGGKMAAAIVNGVTYDFEFSATGQWKELRIGVVKLAEGNNTIEIGGGWNYYRIDGISLIPAAAPAEPLAVAPTLVNANASDEALALMTLLTEHYAKATLSGQTEFPRKVDDDFPLTETNKIVQATGDDAPAIVAFDFMNYSASYAGIDGSADGLTEAMLAAHNSRNVILSGLFHWRAPSGNTGTGDGSFYTDSTTFDFAAALADTDSSEYAALLADIDTVATELKKLADAGVPVLWRPLHEAEGGWFWWGAQGATEYKKLWTLMYQRMTDVHGLNNLIWVFTHTDGLSEDWYPGDEYVDIVGFDGYGEPKNDDTLTFTSQYSTLKGRYDGKKLVALTETGTIPDVSLMHEQNAWWSFFITWNSESWNSDSIIGPQGADAAEIDANYAYDGLINLADLPGGREKISGAFANFEADVYGWEAQLNWAPTDGIKTSTAWAASGQNALSLTKDMTQASALDNVVFQTYPTNGLDVTGISASTIKVNALNAGTNVNAHIFFKAPDGVESWPDAVAVAAGGTELTIDTSEIDFITGLGVRFQGLDGTATEAQYLIDDIRLDGRSIYDFEPDALGWAAQVNWSNTSGITLSRDWADDGAQSLAFVKDLASLGASENIVMQTYPQGGINVDGKSTLTMHAYTQDSGVATDAHIFFKAPDGVESWPDAVAVGADGVELTIDVSEINRIDGLGVRFNSVDSSASEAKFYIDNIQVDGATIASFEDTRGFELQVNWAPVSGLQRSTEWMASGDYSLAGVVSIATGDEVVMQAYPEGGLLLGDDVSTLTLTAYVQNASSTVTAKLWAKDKDGAWRDAGAVPMTAQGVQLSLEIADLTEIQGFGVQFQGLSETDGPFFIDDVAFNE